MKIIQVSEFDFDQVADPVATEASVYKGLLANLESLPPELNYVCLPIADLINTKGIKYTQVILDRLEREIPSLKIYVCQHIWVKNLNFYNNIVYTPHALIGDNLRVIPHYNPCINREEYVPYNNREYTLSFIGSYKTHQLRSQLATLHNGNDIIVEDTGSWHFYKDKKSKDIFKQKYKDTLLNSKLALCPPGTGVSTIRLYEAMSAGVMPVIFNSVKVPELVEDHVIRVNRIEDINKINLMSGSIDRKSAELHDIYWNNFSNERLFSLIL